MSRHVITDVRDLERELRTWYDLDFAFDTETTGLDYVNDRLLGLALTFSDERSYYIVLEHTVPETTQEVQRTIQRVPTGEVEEYEHTTPSGKVKIKTRPVFADQVEETTFDVMNYPTKQFIDRRHFATLMGPLFGQRDVLMVAHNAKFDLHILAGLDLEVRGRLADTMLAAQLINENRSVGLKSLSALVGMNLVAYKELEHYPGFGKEEILGVPLEISADYAMGDTEATLALWNRFEMELAEEGVEKVFRDIWMPLLVVLQQMEARGVMLDLERVKNARELYIQKAQEHEQAVWEKGIEMVLKRWVDDALQEHPDSWWEHIDASYLKPMQDVCGLESDEDTVELRGVVLPVLRKPTKAFRPRVPWFNVGSNLHLGTLLYDYIGLELPTDLTYKRNASGEVGVDRDALVTLRYSLGDTQPKARELIEHVLEYRKASKLISTYLDVYLERSDEGVIRTSFNQAVTDTGRLSSSSPNLQNQPSRGEEGKLVRDLFVARPGMSIVVADYSMMELRVAAHYSGDETMMKAFAEGMDLHTLTASTQSGVPYDVLSERIGNGDVEAKLSRQIGKTSNFGLLYGMGAKKFQMYLLTQTGVRVTEDEAQRLIDGFDSTFAGVTEWKKRVVRWSKRLGYVQTISGRKRRLPDLHSSERWEVMRAERQGVNAVIQGSCSDIICAAMPHIHRSLKSLGGSLLLQVHDELVAEAPTELATTAAKIIETLMTEPANQTLRCQLVAEAGIGQSWGSAKH